MSNKAHSNLLEVPLAKIPRNIINRIHELANFIKEYPKEANNLDIISEPVALYITDEKCVLNDKALALIEAEAIFELAELPSFKTSDLGILSYADLGLNIKLIGNFREARFKLKLDLISPKGEKLYIASKHSVAVHFDNGESAYFEPHLSRLYEICSANYRDCSYNKRISIFSEAKLLLRNLNAKQDDFIKREEIIFLDTPQFTITKSLKGEIFLKEVLPIQYTYFDPVFNLSERDINSNETHKFSINEKTLRVHMSDHVVDFFKKIRAYNSKGQEFLREVVEDPEKFFSESELDAFYISSVEFNERVQGFSFVSKGSMRMNDQAHNNWTNGLEISSVFITSKDGASHRFNTEDILEHYVEVKRALKENNLEDIELPRAQGKFDRADLQRLCDIIENKYDPDVNERNFEEIKSLLKTAYENDLFYIEYDDKVLPTQSVENNLNNLSQSKEKDHKAIIVEIDENYGEKTDLSVITTTIETSPLDFFKENIELRDHQKYFFSHSLSLFEESNNGGRKLGLLLADDMGLGKTIQAISLIFKIKTTPRYTKEPVLIVAPVSLIDTSWKEDGFNKFVNPGVIEKNEVCSFTDFKAEVPRAQLSLEIEQIDKQLKSGVPRDEIKYTKLFLSYIEELKNWAESKILLISYESLRSRFFELLFLKFSLVVLDEAQKVKNINTAQTNAAKSLQSRFNLALTGTPIENSLLELWSIMDFVCPGYLGSLSEFKVDFATPLSQLAPGTQERIKLAEKLEKCLVPLWIRRLKKDVAKDLPQITHREYLDGENIINLDEVVISEPQKKYYLEGLNYFQSSRKGAQLQGVRLLLETCFAPWRTPKLDMAHSNKGALFEVCPKLRRTIEILEEIRSRNEKVIIFVNVVEVQYDLQAFIEDYFAKEHRDSLKVNVFNGRASRKKRNQYIEQFKSDLGFGVIIISPKAGGVGLNLIEANNVIHYTREWNPALEKQATDRVFRIGQKRPVSVYYPVTISDSPKEPTAEQKLARLLCSKRQVIDDFTIVPAENSIKHIDIGIDDSKRYEDYILGVDHLPLIDYDQLEALYAVIFEKMGYETKCVGGSGDMGVDVLCLGKENLLIQVKHTSKNKKLSNNAIQEVVAAKKPYTKQLKKEFQLIAATNYLFSDGTKSIAAANDVKILERRFLNSSLEKFEIYFSELEKKLNSRTKIL